MFFGVSYRVYALFFIVSIIFIFFPQIDLYITDNFYLEESKFFLKHELWVKILYHSVKPLLIGTMVVVVGLWIYNKKTKKTILYINGKVVLYLVVVLAIAPGLIVNTMLKENMGRSRPVNIVKYGGEQEFTPAFIVGNRIPKNASFSSGHAAGAYFTIALALLARRHKNVYLSSAIVYGSAVGLGRIAEGGHFFSDVVTSFFIVYIVSKTTYYFFFERDI
ncbi:MAG: phosphatase PAP2 family protein [Helicobacteraceae bacterium]|nr:phosphatase PAP2 family protein [Helicobacteraceae bacterium]